jgi:dipeptidase
MVALGDVTRDGSVLFAKNSDRQPNEPHIIIHIPRQVHGHGKNVQCTYMEIEQNDLSYEVLLLKPSWMWGCEMGSNEFGLTIGNEAVFTRERYGQPRLIGMDMIRLALERCQNSEEALNLMIYLLEHYGQGGNCGYEKKFTYHNSFIIADPESAWVLETAGEYWAAEKVRDVRSISNCLSIGKTFDRAHPRLIEHAIQKRWCKSERDFDFARCYSDPLFTYFSGARIRRQYSQSTLEKQRGSIDLDLMKNILRSHDPEVEGQQFKRSSLKSICMHGGGMIGDHTTGSYIASLSKKLCTYWATGSSTPCLAIFKPLWLDTHETIPFREEERGGAIEFWRKRERLHRLAVSGQIRNLTNYLQERDRLEHAWEEMVEEMDPVQEQSKHRIMATAWAQEEELLTRMLEESRNISPKYGGSPYFRYYWRNQTERLSKERQRA